MAGRPRQRAFIEALASSGSVSQAARAVNMAPEGAYQLRRQPGAEPFAAAWKAALDHGGALIEEAALDRTIHGAPAPIFHAGAQVGERRVHNERLTMFMLQHRMPEKYGHGLRGGTRHPDTIAREKEEERTVEREARSQDALVRISDQYLRCSSSSTKPPRRRDMGGRVLFPPGTWIELVMHCGAEALVLIKAHDRQLLNKDDWPNGTTADPDDAMVKWVASLREGFFAPPRRSAARPPA